MKMKKSKTKPNARRAFVGTLAAGTAAGISLLSNPVQAKLRPELFESLKTPGGADDIDRGLKNIGKMEHPVAYDMSQAIPWGAWWSNVYYMTNTETGTDASDLGVLIVLRHDGILFSFKDELIEKYKLGELLKGKDPQTGEPALRNSLYEPQEGDVPLPGLAGLKGLMEQGTMICVCNMAYKVYSGAVATMMDLDPDEVYNEFVAAKHPGIELAPSGVWVLGRLAENRIAYIDASLG
jgi:hypothetical protein